MQIETMTVIQDGNEVVINKSDFNPEIHEIPGEPAVTTEQFFVTKSGKSFVITGSLESMSRDEAAANIRALGGTFQTSVGKDTDYLVAGGKVGASKLVKAEKYGTKVIDEKTLLELL